MYASIASSILRFHLDSFTFPICSSMHVPPIVEGIKYVGMTMRKRSILQFNTWFKYDDPLFLELSNVQTFFDSDA